MSRILYIILSFVLTNSLFGATFIPLPMEKQLEHSNSVIQGIYRSSTYKRLPNGDVVTLASFEIEKMSGMISSQIYSHQDFKVMMPGGEWDGLTYFVTGTPKFTPGERVVLLLADTDQGPVINNLALGKYSINLIDDKKILVSSVFPEHPLLGQVDYEQFDQLLTQRFGSGLVEYSVNNHVNTKVSANSADKSDVTGEGRTPASIAEEKANSFSPLLLVLILGLLGAYGAYIVRER